MFELFNSGPRTWKWAVPGFAAVCLLFWGSRLIVDGGRWLEWGTFMVVAGLFGCAIALTNWWKLVSTHREELHRQRKESDAITPRGYIIHEAKAVYPDVLRMILGEQARRWGLVSGSKSPNGEPYAVLMSRPRVTQSFLVYFLRMSNGQTYMPKRMLSENDHSFDPHKVVTAYEMHDDLESLLVEELKTTKPFGDNKPGYWLGEWEPYSVGMDFGVDINDWDVDGTIEEEPAQRVARGGPSSNGQNVVMAKALEGLEQTAQMKARTAKLLGK